MDGKVIQVSALALRPGHEEMFLQELAPIMEATRQIAGCLSFDLYRLSEDRATLLLQETWETQDAHRVYAVSPLKSELLQLLSTVLAQPARIWAVEELCC
jgi:quinol monooxygenase YgiN